MTVTPRSAPTRTATITLAAPLCVFSWVLQPLPLESDQLQRAVTVGGFRFVQATATAFGEKCVTASGEVLHTSILETDFFLTIPVADLTDQKTNGNELQGLLLLMATLPPGIFPGIHPGMVGVAFQQGQQSDVLWFSLDTAVVALQEGLTGEALLTRLRGSN